MPAFFLDYDGTLTPIVDNPFEARLSEEARSVLRSLAMRYKTAIVSGRARLTAHGLVQLDELYYAGSHGFDIAGPRKQRDSDDGQQQEHISYSAADSYRPALESAKAKVRPMHLPHISPHLATPGRISPAPRLPGGGGARRRQGGGGRGQHLLRLRALPHGGRG